MKLTGSRLDGSEDLDATGAVRFVADKAQAGCEDALRRVCYRSEALEGIVGRLIGLMIANGQLRAEQVSQLFDYDVIAED